MTDKTNDKPEFIGGEDVTPEGKVRRDKIAQGLAGGCMIAIAILIGVDRIFGDGVLISQGVIIVNSLLFACVGYIFGRK